MEFVEGETLEKLIKRSGRLKVKLAIEIATQVAARLAAVHLVHRDIKPSNDMVRLEEGTTVTAIFGAEPISKLISKTRERDPSGIQRITTASVIFSSISSVKASHLPVRPLDTIPRSVS
jgi:serine/threonine protein kinase